MNISNFGVAVCWIIQSLSINQENNYQQDSDQGICLPLLSVTSMMMQSFGPGPRPLWPSASSIPERGSVFLLLLELGELE